MHKDQNAATRAGRTRRAAPVRAGGTGEAGGACPGGACPGARGGGKRLAAGGCSNGRKRARTGEAGASPGQAARTPRQSGPRPRVRRARMAGARNTPQAKGRHVKTLGLRDIIGPIMVGPSSSHTAGALAIARMARRLCGGRPQGATFTLYGSFAHTGQGHGTDKALVAGMLGLAADDLRIRDSFSLAREAGLEVEFVRVVEGGAAGTSSSAPGTSGNTRGASSGAPGTSGGVEHPNTVDILIHEEGGGTLSVRGVSVGGGAAVVTRIDGIDVDIAGQHTSVVVRQHDERGVLAHIATCLADCGVNIATTRMYRTRKGAVAYTVMETDDAVPEEARAAIERHPAVRDVRIVPAERAGDAPAGALGAPAAVPTAPDGPTGNAPAGAAAPIAVPTAPAGGVVPAAPAGAVAPTVPTDTPGTPAAPASASAGTDTPAAGDADALFAACDFASGAELLSRCASQGRTIAQAFRAREEALCALDGRQAGIDAYLARTLEVMRASATEPIARPTPSTGGLIGGEARRLAASLQGDAGSRKAPNVQGAQDMQQEGGRQTAPSAQDSPGAPATPNVAIEPGARPAPDGAAHADATASDTLPLLDPLAATTAAYALAVLETNASMGRIVAAPTAGSAGVVPGVLLALGRHRGIPDERLREGLLTAAAVGYLIARNASVSGAEGGCQAEIGSAAAMAAAAAVELAGGTPEQALAAASNALASLMGLVCDPVGGLVEVPCQKRNATAATTALVCAQIALSGTQNLVGFDETVAAMDAVGRALPFELRESALGGMAATPAACAWCIQKRREA